DPEQPDVWAPARAGPGDDVDLAAGGDEGRLHAAGEPGVVGEEAAAERRGRRGGRVEPEEPDVRAATRPGARREQRPGEVDPADPVAVGLREPEVAVRPQGDDGGPAAWRDAGRELGDVARGSDATDPAADGLGEPEVAVRAGRDAQGAAARDEAGRELG